MSGITARFCAPLGELRLDVAFTIPAQGVTAVFGPSGAGKTSVLRCLAGLTRPAPGYLRIAEAVWQDESAGIFLPPWRRPVGYVFQETSLFSHLSVQGNLAFGYRRVAPGERRIAFDQAVELLGLAPLLPRGTAHLSGGERQRVAIGRALLTSPLLLLLDEPLGALDPGAKGEILLYLERLHRELQIPVIYVSHAADEVARVADHLVLMDHGQVLASGTLSDLLTRLDLPISRSSDAEAVITARISGHDPVYHLSRLRFAGGELSVPRHPNTVGSQVRVRILARDVSLTLEPATQTSILNIFPVTVTELAADSPAQMVVRVDAGGAALLSRITRKSADALRLTPGKACYAQVKSVALLD